jgi:hypothetical protein
MTRIRTLGTGLATLVALATFAVSGAQAANKLVLSNGGVPLAKGATVFSELAIATCLQFSEGKVMANEQATDKLTFKKIVDSSCEEDFGASGGIEKASLSASGAVTYTANLKLTVEGPCIYSYSHFKGHIEIPGFAVVVSEEVGKLVKKGSEPECSGTRKELFEADVDIAAFGAPLEVRFLAD